MALTQIELCTDGLDTTTRELLLDVFWEVLRISPGMVSADGNVEMNLTRCRRRAEPEDTPVMLVNGQPYIRVTPDRLRELLGRRRR